MEVKIRQVVNEDLLRERQKCTFDKEELTNLLDGGSDKTQSRRELTEFFISDKSLKDDVPPEYLSHKEKYEEAVRKSCLILKKIKDWESQSNNGGSAELFQSILGGMLGSAMLSDGVPFALHHVMFIPAVLGQGTLKQQAYWVSRAWNVEIMCTYAQTELGHGTFIRGLETTAHYDPRTEEFILHSPTLTSYKWWPGGLGHTANYALVMAQLYTNGQCHGIHPFIVQLRDEDTHMPLPGIKIGEIGAKLGMNATNNGYLGFDHVRIPRDHMLMKHAQVLKDGTYIKSLSDKLTYGTMIFVRVSLIKGVAVSNLAKAVTIATRYSAVRRQSEMKPGEREPQIIDYKTQQHKIFPNLATAIAMTITSNWLWNVYSDVTSQLEAGNLDSLPELHAMSCCLKALCTFEAARGIEECRKSCGGHGYMTCSKLPTVYGLVTAAETYEGENTVLYLQTARYLMKLWHQVKSGEKMPYTAKYLESGLPSKSIPWKNTLTNLVEGFNHVAAGLIQTASDSLDRLVASGKSPEHAWNESSLRLVQCAEAHSRAFLVMIFSDYVTNVKVSPPLKTILTRLCELFAVSNLLRNLGHFLMYSSIRASDVDGLLQWQESLLADIRPNAVSIVDSFDICDEILDSPLGSYDGNVYERLLEEANKSPLNAEPVNVSFYKYLKPFLKSNM